MEALEVIEITLLVFGGWALCAFVTDWILGKPKIQSKWNPFEFPQRKLKSWEQ